MAKNKLRHLFYLKEDHRTKDRKCLHCGEMFRSFHAGHRICERCEKSEGFANRRSSIPEHEVIK